MSKGLFITFEGIDGVGKSTQARLLKELLESQGRQVVHSFEPGGTTLGKSIRKLLLDPSQDISEIAEALLYAADRAQHVSQVIGPALSCGKVVICERFVDSSLAYQGYGLQRDLDSIKSLNAFATEQVMPDITIYLDLEPREALQKSGRDRIEQRNLDYYQRVRDGFYQIAKDEPSRVFVVSAVGSVSEVHSRIKDLVLRRLTG